MIINSIQSSYCFLFLFFSNDFFFLWCNLWPLMSHFVILHCTYLLFYSYLSIMSRCFFRVLRGNNIAFLPERWFDYLINLIWLWVNTSLSSLSNKLERLSSQEPSIDETEIIVRKQGLKLNNNDDQLIYSCQSSLNLIPT